MILVGFVQNRRQLAKLKDMVESLEETTGSGYEAAASIAVMECEDVEFIFEHIRLQHNSEDLVDARNPMSDPIVSGRIYRSD
jgi:hypothetical protein